MLRSIRRPRYISGLIARRCRNKQPMPIKSSLHIEIPRLDYLTWFFERQMRGSCSLMPKNPTIRLPERLRNNIHKRLQALCVMTMALAPRVLAGMSLPCILPTRYTQFILRTSFKLMYPVAMLSVICAGGVWAPIPFNLTSTEAARHFGIVSPKLVFCSKDLIPAAREACEKAGLPASKLYVVTSSPHDIRKPGKVLIGSSLLPWTRTPTLKN